MLYLVALILSIIITFTKIHCILKISQVQIVDNIVDKTEKMIDDTSRKFYHEGKSVFNIHRDISSTEHPDSSGSIQEDPDAYETVYAYPENRNY